MATTQFPMRAKRDDPIDGYMVVQQMVEFLRDQFDKQKDGSARGTNTVLSGNTTANVTLPVSVGTAYSAVVTPQNNPGGAYWVTGKSGSGFTINLAVAAGVSGVTFDWVVRA
jgi:hypothetical protein